MKTIIATLVAIAVLAMAAPAGARPIDLYGPIPSDAPATRRAGHRPALVGHRDVGGHRSRRCRLRRRSGRGAARDRASRVRA